MHRSPRPVLWANSVLSFIYSGFHYTNFFFFKLCCLLVAISVTSGFDTWLEKLPPFGRMKRFSWAYPSTFMTVFLILNISGIYSCLRFEWLIQLFVPKCLLNCPHWSYWIISSFPPTELSCNLYHKLNSHIYIWDIFLTYFWIYIFHPMIDLFICVPAQRIRQDWVTEHTTLFNYWGFVTWLI